MKLLLVLSFAVAVGAVVARSMTPQIDVDGSHIGKVGTSASTMAGCLTVLNEPGWCEIKIDASEVFRSKGKDWGVMGPRSAWIAWQGAAIHYPKMWFYGGGHFDSGMIDVYEADLEAGTINRIYTPPPFDTLYYSDKFKKFAWRHNVSLPVATHTYDGILYDESTGLIFVASTRSYVGGFFEDDSIDPDSVTHELGNGIYAFNPSDSDIKGVAPKSWKRLIGGELPIYYPRSTPFGDGFLLGSKFDLYKVWWEGDTLAYDLTPFSSNGDDWPGTAVEHGGLVYTRFKSALHAWNAAGQQVKRFADQPGANIPHGASLAFSGNEAVYWDGKDKVFTQNLDTGEHRFFDWAGAVPGSGDGAGKVYSKWFKHPDHDDVFVGWASPSTGPMVYRHGGAGVPVSPQSLQGLVNAGSAIPAGFYASGIDLKSPTTVDLNGVTILGHGGNGYVVARGGPHVIRNLTVSYPGRSGIWAQDTPRVTLDGFDISNQKLGVLTSNNGGELHLKNGIIRDGTGEVFGQQHNVYAGEIDKVTVDNFTSLRHHFGGHLFKSRAPYNLIENSRFDGSNSNHSRVMDFPCGGHIEIRDSTMIQSATSDNTDLIAIAVESCMLPKSTLILENTRWVANKPKARFLTTKQHVDIQCLGTNEFVGVPSPCS